jgi:hypothetical protein
LVDLDWEARALPLGDTRMVEDYTLLVAGRAFCIRFLAAAESKIQQFQLPLNKALISTYLKSS